MSMFKVVVATHGVGYSGSETYLVLANKSLNEVHQELIPWHKESYPAQSTMSVEVYTYADEIAVMDIDPAFNRIKVL